MWRLVGVSYQRMYALCPVRTWHAFASVGRIKEILFWWIWSKAAISRAQGLSHNVITAYLYVIWCLKFFSIKNNIVNCVIARWKPAALLTSFIFLSDICIRHASLVTKKYSSRIPCLKLIEPLNVLMANSERRSPRSKRNRRFAHCCTVRRSTF